MHVCVYISSGTQGDITVLIGGKMCSEVGYISDEAVSCMAPPGAGVNDVHVTVSVAGLTLSGVLESGFEQST